MEQAPQKLNHSSYVSQYTLLYCLSHFKLGFLLHTASSFLTNMDMLNLGDPVHGVPGVGQHSMPRVTCRSGAHQQMALQSEAQGRSQAEGKFLVSSDGM